MISIPETGTSALAAPQGASAVIPEVGEVSSDESRITGCGLEEAVL